MRIGMGFILLNRVIGGFGKIMIEDGIFDLPLPGILI